MSLCFIHMFRDYNDKNLLHTIRRDQFQMVTVFISHYLKEMHFGRSISFIYVTKCLKNSFIVVADVTFML
jgi:hypothetical protein